MNSLEKLVVDEEKIGISRVTASRLIDQERIEEEHAAGFQPADHFWKQSPVEKVDRDDVVNRERVKARPIEIDLSQVDCGPRSDCFERGS